MLADDNGNGNLGTSGYCRCAHRANTSPPVAPTRSNIHYRTDKSKTSRCEVKLNNSSRLDRLLLIPDTGPLHSGTPLLNGASTWPELTRHRLHPPHYPLHHPRRWPQTLTCQTPLHPPPLPPWQEPSWQQCSRPCCRPQWPCCTQAWVYWPWLHKEPCPAVIHNQNIN